MMEMIKRLLKGRRTWPGLSVSYKSASSFFARNKALFVHENPI